MRWLSGCWMVLFSSCLLGNDSQVWVQTHAIPQKENLIYTWDFETPGSTDGWQALSNCSITQKEGVLVVESAKDDPYMRVSLESLGKEPWQGKLLLKVTLRGTASKTDGLYWTNSEFPHFTEDAAEHKTCLLDAEEWKTWSIAWSSQTPMKQLRLDPASGEGWVEIECIELYQIETPPVSMEILPAETAEEARCCWKNQTEREIAVKLNGREEILAAGEERVEIWKGNSALPVESRIWKLEVPGFPAIERKTTLLREVKTTADWKIVDGGTFQWCESPDATVAWLLVGEKRVGAVLDWKKEGLSVQVGEGWVEFSLSENATETVECPVVRIVSPMVYAVVPGVEILEAGEWSSSRLDIRTEEHKRFLPDPNLLTQSWMGVLTQDATFRLQWKDPSQQPTFAIPNYFDGTMDGRMGLELQPGEKVRLFVTPPGKAWELNRDGTMRQIADFHRSPTTFQDKTPEERLAQYRLAMETGKLFLPGKGWGHAVEERWKRSPFSGIASALWRIGGDVGSWERFVGGGTHVENDTIYFIRGMASQRRKEWRQAAESAWQTWQTNGRFSYNGKYAEGHFENVALGTYVRPAWTLLWEYAVSGETKYLEAGCEILKAARRFQVARGAQCWEMPLHTPDPLAAAWAIRAHVLAYRFTKNRDFLEEASRWAYEGLTYVYWWDTPERPMQFGATIGVLGATNWKSPNWIGRPVQWIGTVYAYSLLELADISQPPEASFWRKIVEEITLSTERQIYNTGDSVGLLPDSIDPVHNIYYPADINPAVPVALRLRLLGEQDGIQIVWQDGYRVATPFPIQVWEKDSITLQAKPKTSFQILVDGTAYLLKGTDSGKVVFPLPAKTRRQGEKND